MEKKIQVVLLAIEKESKLLLNEDYLEILQNLLKDKPDTKRCKRVHLYFLSNEEVKQGDWFIVDGTSYIGKCVGFKNGNPIDENAEHCDCFEIIASTDESLELPKPSDEFISQYVDNYNKGNIITEVMVEYENCMISDNISYFGNIKLSSNNEIIIKPVVETWDDIIWNYNKSLRLGKLNPSLGDWLKENYEVPKKK